ncbi:two-component system response regulator [Pseudomonas nicosulfuronedens]|uniref:Two-component system response regulator n=1 Tax=Pseudomonas nicosulfuronedens TaxID=2571105 RepID=A0A5R9R8U6_9PSED|nr:two-component system response regulator [Pseudomonas nicosulfuronedens]MDH1010987.1 two-component system response regulator [Pseudomonas nicosulfuronedens]MDH1979510.1 two-component system response regulator [Pseudomonas nicosulfuronedens]MDH2026757.1 two-component system response regulator [Pseudomonas nicosulfuronedens]TLX79463.1 two-component system response regulator [Pseudomonas nicosulfuronedens]
MNAPGPVVRPTILIVDDAPENLTLLSELLKLLYCVKAARSGEKALQIAQSDEPPDLILLDVMMPGMDGFEVCKRLRDDARTRHIPVIFITAQDTADEEIRGLELGAVDYLTKPINPPTVLMRVDNQLRIKAAADFLRDQNEYLEQEVQRRTRELAAIQDVTILAMASLAETRDNETGNHIRRTQHYVSALAEHLQQHPRFTAELDEETRQLLFKSAPLHDIGKVGIPDHILLKPGRLTSEEFEVMKTHTTLGLDALETAEARLGMDVPFLRLAKQIAYGHHEKWDGSGYPQGLAGDAIPLSARLMAVADVYDALISRRIYKNAMPHEAAVEHIRGQRGQHFDPDVVDAFLTLQDEFRRIAERFGDKEAHPAEGATPT